LKSNCLSCSNSYLLNSECKAVCPSGYFGDINKWKCEVCDVACATCFGSTSKMCNLCKDNKYLDASNDCVETCIDGFYPDNTDYKCKPCLSSICATCTGPANG